MFWLTGSLHSPVHCSLYLGGVVVPGHGLGRLQSLHDAGEVDETAGGVQEHLGPSHQPGLGGRDGEGDDPGDVGTGGHLALVRP